MSYGLGLGEALAVLRRWRWWFAVPALLVAAVALIAALTLPPTYRSTATVLIEEAEVPESVVDVGFASYVERRLATITRRVMATENLVAIIDRFDLYPDERAAMPDAALAALMRDAVSLELLSTEVVNPRTGSKGEVTVAFQVGYEYGRADVAQRVTEEIVSLYVAENIQQRRERLTETTEFLADERRQVEERIAAASRQLAAFKAEHRSVLPEQASLNQKMVLAAQAELRDIDRREAELRDQETILEAELSQLLLAPEAASGRAAETSPAARLQSARLELGSLLASYGPGHPDVVRARNEVSALERMVGGKIEGSAGVDDQSRLALERERLALEVETLGQRYGSEHPDVERARNQLTYLDAVLDAASTAKLGEAETNAAMLPVEAQLSVVRGQLAAMRSLRAEARERLRAYEERLARTVEIEPAYDRLVAAQEDAHAQRQSLVDREQSARLGEAIEAKARGEQFTVIEPATLPAAPVEPNRKLIVLAGAVLAAGAGVGGVAVRHLADGSVHGPRDIVAEIGFEPLGVVPNIATPGEQRARLWQWALLGGVLVVAVGCAGLYVQQRVRPLDQIAPSVWESAAEGASAILPAELPWRSRPERP